MLKRGTAKYGWRALVISAALAVLPVAWAAAQTLCAEVRLQIKQEATLEREAFDAALEVTNQYPEFGLTNFRVDVVIKDPQGRSADNLFFVKISSKEAINAVDGTGVVQPASTATVHWLIIPSTGAGGTNPLGVSYSVKADISYMLNGVIQTISTFEDSIQVKPQPALKLEYVLPFEVFADEALTAPIEAVEPFPLGVRITNVGYGPARNFQINSGQPEIIENKQGLAIDFKLLGTYVGDKKIPDTLLIPFGDISAGGVSQAAWIMATSLSGRFIKFDASFTHAAELGGQLTSLIQDVTTYTLVKDVLVDLPGRDGQFDFLVNTTIPRAQLEALLNSGQEIVPELILESDQAEPIQVVRLTSELIGDLNGANTSATLRLTQSVGSNLWVFTSMPAPQDGRAKLVSAVRQDGKAINLKNAWVSRHFNKDSGSYSYRLNLIDYNPPSLGAYTLSFSRDSLDAAPSPITDLSAYHRPVGGQAGLTWSATGEDADLGSILGGRYLIQAATSPDSGFNPSLAQVSITTNTAPGIGQNYLLKDLAGNASYYLKLWLQDTGGSISADSNLATAYVLPNPPADLTTGEVSASSVAVGWNGGNNNSPIEYGIWVDTDSVLPAVAAAPFKDPFDRTFVFEGLTPNTTYNFYGVAKNPVSGASSQQVYLGQTLTLAAVPVRIVSSQLFASSFTVAWDAGGNPAWTEYFVQVSTAPDWAALAGESGWVAQASYTFGGLVADTTYYARAKARNLAGVETAYADLGALQTLPLDALPPVTRIVFSTPSFGTEPVFVSSLTGILLAARDDAAVDGDGRGGLGEIHYAVDSDTFSVYAGRFSIAASGAHIISYYAVDTSGNTEEVKTSSVTVDDAAPAALADVAGLVFSSASVSYVPAASTVTLAASDDASGVKELYYEVNGSTYSIAAASVTLELAEGVYSIAYRAADNLGNVSEMRVSSVTVDNTAPLTEFSVAGSSLVIDGALYVINGSSLALSASDASAGIKEIVYSLDGSSAAAASPLVLPVSTGAHVLSFYAVDNAGNAELERAVTFFVDAEVPVTTASAAGLAGENGWYVSPVGLTLHSTDTMSGVEGTFYSLSRAGVLVSSGDYVSAITSAEEGFYGFTFYSADRAGNIEPENSGSFKIDLSSPALVAFSTPSANAQGWNNTSVNMVFSGTDPVSGIAFCTPEALMELEGSSMAISGYCSNNAGLVSTALVTVSIDTTAPVVSYTLTPEANSEGWNNSDVVADFTCSDALSGVATCPDAIMLASEGVGISTGAEVFDLAGNMSEASIGGINIDRGSPVSTATVSGVFGNGYYNSAVSIVITSADPLSGVATAFYSLDGGAPIEYQSAIEVGAAGAHTVKHYAVDRAGNVEPEQMLTFNIDTVAPVVSYEITPQPNADGWNNASVGVAFSGTDAHSGIDSCTPAQTVSMEGASQAIVGSCTDLAGNVAYSTAIVNVDLTVPEVSATGNPAANAAGWNNTVVNVQFNSTDALSGIAYCSEDRSSDTEGAGQLVSGYCVDFAGLSSTVTLTLNIDKNPAVTGLDITGIRYSADGKDFVSTSGSYIGLHSTDTLSGVQTVYGVVDPSPEILESGLNSQTTADFATYLEAFTLQEGARTIGYGALDKAGNYESLRTGTIYADGTPPITVLGVNGEGWISQGAVSVLESDDIMLLTNDPPGNGVFSGNKKTLYMIEATAGGGEALLIASGTYTEPFKLPAGSYLVSFHAEDYVSNIEADREVAVTVAPGILEISFMGVAKSTSAILWTWNNYPGATGYQIYASTGGAVTQVMPQGETAFLQNGLPINTLVKYFLRIYAGEQIDSGVQVVATLAALPETAEIFDNGQSAVLVLGQSDFVSKTYGLGPNRLRSPVGANVDPEGNIWISDYGNNRVLRFSAPFSNGANSDLVIGQADFVSNNSVRSANRLYRPGGLAFDKQGNLWVADMYCRIIRFSKPFSSGMSADIIIGASDFNDYSACGTSANRLSGLLMGMRFDEAGNLWVADAWNNRVVVFNPPFASGMNASLVLGQPNFMSSGYSYYAPQPYNMFSPFDVNFDSSGNALVADSNYGRVLLFRKPFSNGMSAEVAIGQPDLFSSQDTTGNYTPSQNRLTRASSVELDDYDNMYVVDPLSHRILKFSPPFTTGMKAALVLGQYDFDSNFNINLQGSFYYPYDASLSGLVFSDSQNRLWVADYGNNRVLMFKPVRGGIFSGIGISSFTVSWTPGGNIPGTRYEVQISVDNEYLAGSVVERYTQDNSYTFTGLNGGSKYYARVRALNLASVPSGWVDLHYTLTKPGPVIDFRGTPQSPGSIRWEWSAASPEEELQIFSSTGGAISGVLRAGTTGYLQTGLLPNAIYSNYLRNMNMVGASDSMPSAAVTLANKPRPVEPFLNGQNAKIVIGEDDFTSVTLDISATHNGGGGTALDNDGNLWVLDGSNCRVLRFSPPFSSGMPADLVLGQDNFETSSCGVAENKFKYPTSIAVDRENALWVADAYSRLLRFTQPNVNGKSADLVLGQSDFVSSSYGTSDSKLKSPRGMAFDAANNLWVADNGNHRVLRFPAPFQSGMASDLVIGQNSFISANFSQPATAKQLGYPTDVDFDADGNLWITDNYNNRLLMFQAPFSVGMAASLAVGGSLTAGSRFCLTIETGVCYPAAAAFDRYGDMYVSDTTNQRVLKYNAPFHAGMLPAAVLGKENFSTKGAELAQDKLGYVGSLNVGLNEGNQMLWVADGGNSRVVGFEQTGFSTVAPGASSVVLTWLENGNPPGTEYRAEISSVPDFTEISWGSDWSPATSITLDPFDPGATYYFSVKSRNSMRIETGYAYLGQISPRKEIVVQSTTTVEGNPEIVLSAERQMTISALSPEENSWAVVLASAAADGLVLLSNVYEIGPEGTYVPPATLSFYYSTSAFNGIPEDEIAVYEYFQDSGWIRLEGQVLDTVTRKITVPVHSIASLFGIFWKARDIAEPVTYLQVSTGSWVADDGLLFVSENSSVTLVAFDPIVYGSAAGVAFTEYRLDPSTSTAAFIRYTTPFVLAKGLRMLEFRSQDNAGNLEVAKSSGIYVDGAAPITYALPTATTGQNGWYTSTVALTLTSTDAVSGVGAAFYRVVSISSGGSEVPVSSGTYSSPVIISNEGLGKAYYYSMDNVANIEPENAVTINIDISSPIVSGIVEPSSNTFGWWNGPVAVIAAGTDAVSGIAYCSPDKLLETEVSGLTVRHYCMDNAGWSSTATLTVSIDTTAPSIAYAQSPPANEYGWNASSVTLGYTCADALSGVSVCPLDVLFSMEGVMVSTLATVFDYAGNSESVSVNAINIDMTPPVSSTALTGTFGNGWYSSPVVVTLTSTDALSGIKETLYSLDGAPAAAYQQALTVAADGAHTAGYYAVDKAGNTEVQKNLSFSIDRTAPQTGYALSSQPNADGWNNTAVNVVFNGTDTLSGVEACYTGGVGTEGAGQQIAGWCRDRAGNTGYSTATVSVDLIPPAVNTARVPAPNADGWNNSPVVVRFIGEDAVSGVAFCTADKTVSEEGAHSITGSCTDRAGNVSNGGTSVKMDVTAPVVSYAQTPEANGAGWNNGDVTIEFDCSDSRSGVKACPGAITLAGEGVNLSTSAKAYDMAGNSTQTIISGINIDKTAPVIMVSSPVAGNVFVATKDAIRPFFSVMDNFDPAPVSYSYLEQVEDRGSPRGDRPAKIAVTNGQSIEPLDIDDGIWQLIVSATDFADNAAHLLGGTFEVIHDVLAPASDLHIIGTRYDGDRIIYLKRDTAFALTSIDDLVQSGDSIGLGVKEQSVRVWSEGFPAQETAFENALPKQGAPFISTLTFNSLWSLPDGRYNFDFRAEDILGNIETTRHSFFGLDDTAPETSALAAGDMGDNGWHISTVTVTLSAADALSGVAGIFYRLDGAEGDAFAEYSEAFSVSAEGEHTVRFYAKDNLGNTGAAASAFFKIDRTAPEVSEAIAPAANQDGWHNGTVSVAFSGTDAVSGISYCEQPKILRAEGRDLALAGYCRDYAGLSSTITARFNVDLTSPTARIERAPLANAKGWNNRDVTASFICGDALSGVKVCPPDVAFTSEGADQGTSGAAFDYAGNRSSASISGINIDKTPPVSSLSASGDVWPAAGNTYLSLRSRIALSAADPVSSGTASGIEGVDYSVDSGAFQVYVSTFGLTEGLRTVHYRARDNAGNIEAARSAEFLVDNTAPQSALTITQPKHESSGEIYVSTWTLFTLASNDPVVNSVASGVRNISHRFGIDAFGQYSTGFIAPMPDGAKTLAYFGTDNVGNAEAAKSKAVKLDATAPLTALNIAGGMQHTGPEASSFYASLASRYGLPAVDPIVGGVASGVKQTFWTDNDGVAATSTSGLAFSEGRHVLTYRSVDNVENLEVIRSTTILVDNTAPATMHHIGSPYYVGGGVNYITPATPVTFTANDPVAGEVASGVNRIEVSINGAVFIVYSAALQFAEGRHTIKFRAVDNVGNVEAERTLEVQSDNTAPVSGFVPSGQYFEASGRKYAPLSFTYRLTAADPVVSDVASGVKFSEYRLDGGTFATFGLPFGLTEGIRLVEYRSHDNVANIEELKSATVHVDNTVPLSTLAISQPEHESEGDIYVSSWTVFSLASIDPETNNVASGVRDISFRFGSVPYGLYSAGFNAPLPDGDKVLQYFGTDNVGNTEPARSKAVKMDATPPLTALAVTGGMQFTGQQTGSFYASLASRFSLPSVDPVTGGVASGVRRTSWSDNGGAAFFTTKGLSFSEGRHVLTYRSSDNVENLEVIRSTTILVDNTAPVATHHIGSPYYIGGGVNYITPATPVSFTAVDPVSGEVSAGVSRIEVSVDGAAYSVYSAALKFAEGRHTIKYRAIDNVGNTEAEHTLEVQSDNATPQSALTISQPKHESSGEIYVSTWTLFTLASNDPVVNSVASGVRNISHRFGIDAFGQYSTGFIAPMPDGVRTLAYYGTDNVGNAEAAKSKAVKLDATAPRTALNITGGMQHTGPQAGSFYASLASRYGLPAVDPIVGGVASGVQQTFWTDNDGVAATSTSGLAFSEGRHVLAYRSSDNVENLEVIRSTTILVDNTAPVATHHIGSPYYIGGGVNYITPATPVSFTAADPVSGEVSAGVSRIEVSVDGAAYSVYSAALKFAEGRHMIKYRAIDNVGNIEAEKTLEVQSDNTAPVSGFVSSGRYYEAAGNKYAPLNFSYELPFVDPVVNNVASGVKFSEYRIDGAAFSTYVSAFSLTEGIRSIEYRSHDNVSNGEPIKTAAVYVDNTAPQSALTISQPKHESSGEIYVSTWTLFTLASNDPVVNSVASGVWNISHRFGIDAYGQYSTGFIAPMPDGAKTLAYYGTDNVGNAEAAKSKAVKLDATAPLTALNIAGGTQHAGPEASSFYASLASRFGLLAVDPIVGGVASGVKQTFWTDNDGVAATSTSGLAFSEGRHVLVYRSIDNVDNLEVIRSTTILVDNTAPVTTHHIGSPYYIGGGVNHITPATPVSFTAADPVSSEVAAGVSRIEVSIDGAAFSVYSAALKFGEGRHTIKYRAIDNVGNTEAEKTLDVQSDNTPPASAWLVSSGENIELAGKLYLNARGKIALEGADPVAAGVASGVEGIYYGVDADPLGKFMAPFGLTEGIRTLKYSARDNVLNTEVAKSTVIYVDGTNPVSGLTISGDQYHGDKVYVSPRSEVVITAADPVVNGVASGVYETKYAVDGGAFKAYAVFKLAAEGKRAVAFYSADQVANTEVVKTSELWVDAAAPGTELAVSGPRHDAGSLIYITKDSGIVLTPADPISNETASGVLLTKYRVVGSNWQVYASSFTITAEGRHALEYYSIDRVQNAEVLKTASLAVDNTPPATAITLGEPKFEAFGLPVLTPDALITLAAADMPTTGAASGLKQIFYEALNVATGSSGVRSYIEPFKLPQGTYDVRFWSVDNVGNIETFKQLRLAVSTLQDDALAAVEGLDLSGSADIAGGVNSNGLVSLNGSVRILGDVAASTITLKGKAEITGQQTSAATPLVREPIVLADIVSLASNANNNNLIAAKYLVDGKLVVSAQADLTLSTGVYYFTGIDLAGGCNISINGDVDIVVAGDIHIGGGSSFNAAGPASALNIFSNTGSTLTFIGGGNLAAYVYAPYAHMKLSGKALLGGHYFVRSAEVSSTGNILQSGEALPQTAKTTDGGGRTKASAMSVTAGAYTVLAGPDPAFRLGEVYVFPNPALRGAAPVFHIEVGMADRVKITIYTVSGRHAHEYTLTGMPAALDDGNGLSYAYEYTWRDHIPSGVYYYHIEAEKAGQKIKKTGKFAVVR